MKLPTYTVKIDYQLTADARQVLHYARHDRDRRFRYACLLALWSLGLAWLLLGCAHRSAIASVPLGHTEEEQAGAAVRIEVVCLGDPFREGKGAVRGSQLGSGALVSPYDVVTAAHVVDCPLATAIIGVVTRDGKRRVADVARIDYVRDVARLVVREPVPGARSPGFRRPVNGEVVVARSSVPKARSIYGRVKGTTETRIGYRRVDVELAMSVEPGNSGAPVYGADGRIVGVVTHSEDVLGLCAFDAEFCWGRASTLVGKGVLP